MVKTTVAALICGIMGFVRGQVPLYSIMTAVLCIQPNTSKSISTSVDRVIGTAIGGAAGFVFVYAVQMTDFQTFTPLYYLVVTLLFIPLIYINVLIRRREASILTCMVFLAIAITNAGDDPLMYAIHRIVDTLIGIGVALLVNIALPNHYHEEGEKKRTEINGQISIEEHMKRNK